MVEALVRNINNTLTDEFMRTIDARYSSEILKSNEATGLLSHFEDLKTRLRQAIDDLERRANVNLIIGIVTTMGAIAGLYYIIFVAAHSEFKDSWDVAVHYVPRIYFVIFVEVFAYFFLKLYKNNIDDIKYYHNELTNIDAKLIALRSALMTSDEGSAKSIIGVLSKTERNFILRKGETTSELERARIDGKGTNESLKQILGIFKLVAKQEGS